MRFMRRSPGLALALAVLPFFWPAAGCGGGGGSSSNHGIPITAALGVTPVVVPQDGAPANVNITITSTSETALVSIGGLPVGIQEKYAASGTNPSGTLTFVAGASTPAGSYSPTITVNSAGQTASLLFALV